MSGSKKGEHRGGAKAGKVKRPYAHANLKGHSGGVPGRKAKPIVEIGKEVMQILASRAETATKEQKLEQYFLITGKRSRVPKEVMLCAMAFYEETAIEDVELMQANIECAGRAKSKEARDAFLHAAELFEARVRLNLTNAVDVAYKLAPYIHPRLSAIMTNPGTDGNQLNILQTLFKDLDEAGRPSRYIDHDPEETKP
jgi:hypothetical protein